MFLRWTFTVPVAIPKMMPISSFVLPLANQYRTSVARAPNAKGLSFCKSNAESVLRNPLPKYSDNHYISIG